MRALSEGLCRA